MLEFFKRCLIGQEAIWKFCNMNSDEEYDFTPQDVRYLSNHIRSANPLSEFTEEDIK